MTVLYIGNYDRKCQFSMRRTCFVLFVIAATFVWLFVFSELRVILHNSDFFKMAEQKCLCCPPAA